MARKTLVLDVCGTLMCEINARVSPELVGSAIRLQGDELGRSMILKRPHLSKFLERMAKLFDVVAFTSRAQRRAETILDVLDPAKEFFSRRLYLDSCKKGGKVKDLAVLERPLNRVIIVDDTSSKCVLNPDNLVLVSRFKRHNLSTDRGLLDLIPFLEELSKEEVEDVRPVIHARFGKKVMNVLKQQERDSDHQTGETKMKGHQVEGSGRINALGRALTKILRHRAAELNLEMRSDGFCRVADLLRLDFTTRSKVPLSSHTVEEVLQAVEQNSKERLATMVDESGELLIRANQGHTLLDAVCSDDLLEEISIDDNLLAVCVHGTFKHALPGILRDGLKTMGRKHVHFAAGLPGAGEVVSGMRGNCDALVFVNAARAMADGMKFYVSKNGVVLTEGFEQCVPAKYFDKIVEWPSNVLLHDREEITE